MAFGRRWLLWGIRVVAEKWPETLSHHLAIRNEKNGAWKRSQQIVKLLRREALDYRDAGSVGLAEALERIAATIESGEVL